MTAADHRPHPTNGVDRCECGCKYWAEGLCIDCGELPTEWAVYAEHPTTGAIYIRADNLAQSEAEYLARHEGGQWLAGPMRELT